MTSWAKPGVKSVMAGTSAARYSRTRRRLKSRGGGDTCDTKSLGGCLQQICCHGHLLQEDDCWELRKLIQQDSQAAKGGLPGYVEGEEGEGG